MTGSIDDLRDESESISDAEDEASPAKKSRPEIGLTKTTEKAHPAKKSRGPIVDDPFYGFLPSEVPERTIIFTDDGADVDLTTPLDEQLILLGDELTPEDLVTDEMPVKAKRPSIVVPMSSIATSPKAVPEPTKTISVVQTSTLQSPAPRPSRTSAVTPKTLPSPMVRESREWKPSAQFFKPLSAG